MFKFHRLPETRDPRAHFNIVHYGADRFLKKLAPPETPRSLFHFPFRIAYTKPFTVPQQLDVASKLTSTELRSTFSGWLTGRAKSASCRVIAENVSLADATVHFPEMRVLHSGATLFIQCAILVPRKNLISHENLCKMNEVNETGKINSNQQSCYSPVRRFCELRNFHQ